MDIDKHKIPFFLRVVHILKNYVRGRVIMVFLKSDIGLNFCKYILK